MLGQKHKAFQGRVVSLEQLVPQDHFYRKLEAKLDLRFVYELVKDCYASARGRPSIDPVVFFKLQLIMFFEGIRSERRLMEQVQLNLAHRWYLGYDLDEAVPDHSSLSKIRGRYGLVIFHRFFEKIVERCQEAGLVWGKELYFDGTKIRANAAVAGMVPRWYWQAKQHLAALFPEEEITLPAEAIAPPSESPAAQLSSSSRPEPSLPVLARLVAKYDGTRLPSVCNPSYQRVIDKKVSPIDPDASPMSGYGDGARLGYHTHYVVDGGKARIILAALVTPASIMDNLPMLDLARWVRFRWQLKPKIAVGDTKYGTTENIVGLATDGIRAYLPTPDFSGRTGLYPPQLFQYDAEQDRFRCPQGHELPLLTCSHSEEVFVYRADAATCNACPVKAQCTKSKNGRYLRRSFSQAYLDQAEAYRATAAYHKALRKRQVWVEPLFGEGKQWHHMTKFRLRGLEQVNIEGVMKAAGQNIKRLLRDRQQPNPKHPVGGATLLALLALHPVGSTTAVSTSIAPCKCFYLSRRLFQQAQFLLWNRFSLNCYQKYASVAYAEAFAYI
jgi:transposase